MSGERERESAAGRLRRVEALYHGMLARPPHERAAALAEACPEDPALAAEVQSLLDQPDSGAGPLAEPALEIAARQVPPLSDSLIGQRVGAFEVQALLGVGGMGEVYRARDTRLGRSVAIKILPRAFTSDPDRLARFEREARVLASLNHPNIGTLYGLEEIDGVRALVLEFVEGRNLSDRIGGSGLPLSEAVTIARQIAEALGAAHEKGIVHRDLKPANIMITPSGAVKVLDFGLAKPGGSGVGAQDLSNSPTTTREGTREGVILGTAAYMSPEQARGKPVDNRTDIWAFGCVLYEMLTGRQAFGAETMSDAIAGVLDRDPDWNALPAATPASTRRLLERCLTKDSNRRLRDIGDAALELVEPGPPARTAVATGKDRRAWVAMAAAALAVTAVIIYLRPAPPAVRQVRLEIPLPVGGGHSAISPDGSRVAYEANELWVRPLNAVSATMLAGTYRGIHPFWSPDSRWIGFFADGKVMKVQAAGGPPQILGDAANSRASGAWNGRGTILFSAGGVLRRISESGGQALPVTELDRSLGEIYHLHPSFLPDGRHFFYLAWSATAANRRVYIGSLDSNGRTPLMDVASKAVYASPGFVLFGRPGSLVARPFDAGRLRFTGDETAIAEPFELAGTGYAPFNASDEGTLTYKAGGAATDFPLRWADRGGKTSEPLGAIPAAALRLSPDGKRVAFSDRISLGSSGANVWIHDLDDGKRTKLTSDSSISHWPIWSPDGSRIIFDSNRGREAVSHALYEKLANGATPERLLLEPPPGMGVAAQDWSRDGRLIVFVQGKTGGPFDLWYLPLYGDRKPVPYLITPFDEENAALSPDGRWLAYATNESGSFQVVVRSFPDPSSEKRQISVEGGTCPRWRADGREIYYLEPSGRVVAVQISTEKGLSIGGSSPLFKTAFPFSAASSPEAPFGSSYPYDVAPDGQKFLISGGLVARPIVVVMNWAAGLKRP